MQQINFHAMGCRMLVCLDPLRPEYSQVVEKVPDWFEVWEARLSRFRKESELSELNRSSGPVQVSPVLWDVLLSAFETYQFSEGLVSPFLLNQIEAAGYDRSFEKIGDQSTSRPTLSALKPTSPSKFIIHRKTRTIQLPEGVRMDLGGIGKGWAADRALRSLSKYGPALIDAGGDIALSAPKSDGTPWPIAISDPLNPESDIALLLLARGGLATSGRDYRHWERSDGQWHHIIDPRTGRPGVTDVLTATVIGPSASLAETAAKVAFLLGSQKGLAWLENHKTLAGFLVLENGEHVQTRSMRNYLWRN